MNRNLIALVLLSAFILFVACGGDATPEAPPTTVRPTAESAVPASRATSIAVAQAAGICGPGSAPAYIKGVVLALDTVGDKYTPVDITEEYAPTQTSFHAVVSLEDAPDNLKLGSMWYLVQATGYTSKGKIDESVLDIAEGGTRNVDFTLSTTQDTWPSGAYCVEIYAEGNLALSKYFTVVANSTPSNATSAVLKQVVLAEDADPGTFTPINPTSTFKSNLPRIHATLEIFGAPANTRFRARWYPPSQPPLDFDLTTEGTGWRDLYLTSAPGDFPTGQYKVEIYVNDELAETKTFLVE